MKIHVEHRITLIGNKESVLERLGPARPEFEALRLLRQLHESFLLRVAMRLFYIGNEW